MDIIDAWKTSKGIFLNKEYAMKNRKKLTDRWGQTVELESLVKVSLLTSGNKFFELTQVDIINKKS